MYTLCAGKADWTPEQCETRFVTERARYIQAIREFSLTESGQENRDSNRDKVAEFNESKRPAQAESSATTDIIGLLANIEACR